MGTGILSAASPDSGASTSADSHGEMRFDGLPPVENVYSASNPGQLIFKKVEVAPSVVEVGSNEEFKITLTIGPAYAPLPTRLAISLPTQLGFSKPALFIDEDYGYLEVCSNNAGIEWEKRIWDVQNDFFVDRQTDHPRKWGQHLAIIDVSAGLREDDYIRLTWGDLGRGFGKGTQTTVLCPKTDCFQYIWVRYYADQSKGVPDMERDITNFHQRPVADAEAKVPLRILPKPLQRWRLIRKTSEALLVPLDLYGNVTPVRNIKQEIDGNDAYRLARNGVYHYANPTAARSSV